MFKNISRAQLQATIGQGSFSLIEQVGAFAARRGIDSFIVGGVVRDALLETTSDDVDVLVLGDAIDFVDELEAQARSSGFCVLSVTRFRKYGTAKVNLECPEIKQPLQVDFASARSEEYPESGKPPVVSPGNLASDLDRRDFSINALAIHIKPELFGQIEDRHRGIDDLRARRLRVLHQQSFVDDPARLIRLMRFKVRLGFEIESATHVLFDEACNQRLLERLDGFRLFDEYRKALCEQNPESVIEALHEADLLKYVLPVGLKWNPNTLSLSAITRSGKQALLRKRAYDYWKAVYTFICQTCSNDEFQQHIAGFGLSKEVRSELVSLHSYWRD